MLKLFKNNGETIFEAKTKFNKIKVIREGKRLKLILDDTGNLHSTKIEGRITTGSYWDICAVSGILLSEISELKKENRIPEEKEKFLILGLGAGTISTIMKKLKPEILIYGVDVDEKVVEVGKKYFSMLCDFIFIDDCIEFIRKTKDKFSGAVIDVFSNAEIPSELFYKNVWKKLSENIDTGVVANTISLFQTEYMKEVSEEFFSFNIIIKNPESSNYIFIAIKEHIPRDIIEESYRNIIRRTNEMWKRGEISEEDRESISENARVIYEGFILLEMRKNVFVQK
jgi:predicted membrane-bound spermidine synthase